MILLYLRIEFAHATRKGAFQVAVFAVSALAVDGFRSNDAHRLQLLGYPGRMGSTGLPGVFGAIGEPGQMGLPGSNGLPGPIGNQGRNGQRGMDGDQGKQRKKVLIQFDLTICLNPINSKILEKVSEIYAG